MRGRPRRLGPDLAAWRRASRSRCQRSGEFGLGRELRTLGDARGGAPAWVADRGLRQVELAVDRHVPGCGGVGEVDRDLRVLHPARGSGVLALYPGRAGALLDIPGLLHHQHPVWITEVLHDVAADIIADTVSVPGPRQQVLHAAGRSIPGVLGDRPAVLAGQFRQQAQHERPHPPPRLHSAETSPDPQHQLIEQPQPAARVNAVAGGHSKIITCCHKPG